ncbi:MAG: hypothetical protein K6F64_10080 [Clostridia bacterium]|nr:hypothetical protein [Clostridia bacterium]
MAESKREKFVRIAEARTNKTISMIKLLGNCANRSTYDYSKSDVKKIFSAIEEELKLAKSKFDAAEDGTSQFKL